MTERGQHVREGISFISFWIIVFFYDNAAVEKSFQDVAAEILTSLVFYLPFLLLTLMHVPPCVDEVGDGGSGGGGTERGDGGTLGSWKCPDGRSRWVSGRVAGERLSSSEERVEMGGGKGRWRSCWI